MRDIKFRAWDKIMKVMSYDGSLPNGEEMVMNLDGGFQFSGVAYKSDDFILMQYTGLKDRNGKEIYEGDVLHVLEVSEHLELEYTSPVEYIDCGFLVTEPSGTQVPLACFCNLNSYPLIEVEIIGNIHDNPELLTGGKADE